MREATIEIEDIQGHVIELCREAIEMSRLAKEVTGPARRGVYRRKEEILSGLLLMDHVEIDSVEFRAGCLMIGLTLPTADRLHALTTHLTLDAREVAFRRIKNLLETHFLNIQTSMREVNQPGGMHEGSRFVR